MTNMYYLCTVFQSESATKVVINIETGNNMATKIIAPHGVKKQIQRVFGYSQPTIRRAFNGYDDTYAAKRIRYYALLHGGAEYVRSETSKV